MPTLELKNDLTDVTKVDYGFAPITAFKVEERSTGKAQRVTRMSVDGRSVRPTQRFWTSLCSNYSSYGLTPKLFKLYSEDEVFTRLVDRVRERSNVRFAIEDHGAGEGTLLAVTNPAKPLIPYDAVRETLGKYASDAGSYAHGIISTRHTPAHMSDFKLGPDTFSHKYEMETPIDGFGEPLIYLSLLRMVCINGMVGYSRAFKSAISLGRTRDGGSRNDPLFSIERALDSFSNEEGYAALRNRFEAAQNSWASISEANAVYKTLSRLAAGGNFVAPEGEHKGNIEGLAHRRAVALQLPAIGGDGASEGEHSPLSIKMLRAYTALTGDICQIYGIAQMDALSTKRQARLPSKASVYDLFGFVSEAASHYTDNFGAKKLQAEIGNLLGQEYDLENSFDAKPTFSDWFVATDSDEAKTVKDQANAHRQD